MEVAAPQTRVVSEAASVLLRRRFMGERVEVTPETKSAYRELVAAGFMYPVSGFTSGPEAHFRFTEEGWKRREAWLGLAPLP